MPGVLQESLKTDPRGASRGFCVRNWTDSGTAENAERGQTIAMDAKMHTQANMSARDFRDRPAVAFGDDIDPAAQDAK